MHRKKCYNYHTGNNDNFRPSIYLVITVKWLVITVKWAYLNSHNR